MKPPKLVVLVALSSVTLCLVVHAADWPQWRGPLRNAASSETGLLKEWPREGPKLLWQNNDIGDGYSTPAVAGDRVYTLSNRGLDNEYVQVLSAKDGKVLWTTTLGRVGNPDQRPSYPCSRSTATVEGNTVYALSSDGDLASLDAATGRVNWKRSLRADFGGQPHTWAYAESPLIDGDALIVTPGGAKATMVALNKKTGAVVWQSAVPGGDQAGYSSAVAVEAAGQRQYVQFLMKGLVGVDAKTGRFLWRYDGAVKGQYQASTPVPFGEHVYIGAGGNAGGGMVRLAAAGGGVAAEQVYFTPGLPNGNGGAVLVGGTLYGSNNRGLVAVEFMTGRPLWQTAQGEGIGPASVMYADGRLYLHGFNNEVALVEATPQAYRELGRFVPPGRPQHPRGERESAWPHPVVANGRLYIRDLGTLWCYDVSTR
ncbi:MAG TPA: PQQ-binding-like beta-propeller repeat protein [Bryobacteraceae bacterium]|nr:PQQ-binding-like beta-propeller repeat protein [Bryobacteraceae bacterium]